MSGIVVRMNTNLSGSASLVYSTYLGGTNPGPMQFQNASEADGIAVDAIGNAYVVGVTLTETFPHNASFGTGRGPASGHFLVEGPGWSFVSKISPDGRRLLYSTFLRGARATAIGVDAMGQAFVTGAALQGLATTPGAFQGTFRGGAADGFVTKLSPDGNALQYSTYLGGTGSDVARDIAVNNYGMTFIRGLGSNGTDIGRFPYLFLWIVSRDGK
jgi:hypothetical protein